MKGVIDWKEVGRCIIEDISWAGSEIDRLVEEKGLDWDEIKKKIIEVFKGGE